jgi:hypothetical protein
MVRTMTWVGLDVHARSTHAAAIDAVTGELSRMRFGASAEAPVEWLRSLSGPRARLFPLGRRDRRLTSADSTTVAVPGRRAIRRPARAHQL